MQYSNKTKLKSYCLSCHNAASLLLLNAHAHNGIVGIHHALEPNSAFAVDSVARAGLVSRGTAHASRFALGAATSSFVAAGALWPRARGPSNIVALHWALNDWRVVSAKTRAHSSTFEADGVEIIIATALCVDAPSNFRCCR